MANIEALEKLRQVSGIRILRNGPVSIVVKISHHVHNFCGQRLNAMPYSISRHPRRPLDISEPSPVPSCRSSASVSAGSIAWSPLTSIENTSRYAPAPPRACIQLHARNIRRSKLQHVHARRVLLQNKKGRTEEAFHTLERFSKRAQPNSYVSPPPRKGRSCTREKRDIRPLLVTYRRFPTSDAARLAGGSCDNSTLVWYIF